MQGITRLIFGLLIIISLGGCATAALHPSLKEASGLPDLIPVRDFVANRGSNFSYRISPDGDRLAWIAVEGISLHLFVRDRKNNSQRSFPMGHFYGGFEWLQDSRHLIYGMQEGDENTALVVFDTEQSSIDARGKLITPWGGVKSKLVSQIADDPDHLLVAHNQREATLFDLYRVNIHSGKQTLLETNPGHVSRWLADTSGQPMGRIVKHNDEHSLQIRQADGNYRDVYAWSAQDDIRFVSLSNQGEYLYLLSNRDRDKQVLIRINTASSKEDTLLEDPSVDITSVYPHPVTGRPLLAMTQPDYPHTSFLDTSMKDLFGFIHQGSPIGLAINSSDRAFHWLTLTTYNDKGYRFYLYDVQQKQLQPLGVSPSLEFDQQLSDIRPVHFKSRDGTDLHGYLALPRGVPPERLPMVLWVHGGPGDRDEWRYNAETQFLANRGYAVLRINYRGSTGYGRHFQELGFGEFARAMQYDLLDGVNWAITEGIADPERIAIGGGSYGGYASLIGLTDTPETFACGIDLFGPTDLLRLTEDFPPYWKLEMDSWYRYVGDPKKPEDRVEMLARSPLYHSDQIQKPLLVIQGDRDVRVRPEQSNELVKRLLAQHKPVEYWLVPQAGHGVSHWPQRLQQFRMTEDFLAACLGGRSGGFDLYQLGSWMF